MKKILQITIGMVLVGAFGYWQLFTSPQPSESQPILFQIEAGQGLKEIAQNLEAHGIIRSNKTFILYTKIRGLETSLRQGRYQLSANENAKMILEILTNPERGVTKITIPEGFSIRGIDERLTEMGVILPGEFSAQALSLEGFLFPDTYSIFSRNFDPEDLIKKMQDNFLKKLTPDLLREMEKRKRTLPQVITMASILEKEVRTEKDYPIVAGILWKRLDHDWPLQADATLLYGKSATSISQKELETDSPYNTRKFKGLPPTPINNPGVKTVRAAIYAEGSPYWFYLTDSEGNVHYAKTNEEQNENRRKYL